MNKYIAQIVTGITVAVASPAILWYMGIPSKASTIQPGAKGSGSQVIVIKSNEEQQNVPATTPPKTPVRVILHDHLGPEQVSNQVTVTIGGISQTFYASTQQPTAEQVFTLPEAGTYNFTVQAQAQFMHEFKPIHAHLGQGQGQITVNGGETFDIAWDYSYGYQPFSIGMINKSNRW